MKYKLILLLGFLSLNTNSIYSQIYGYVKDEQNTSIPYVNVVLLSPTDSTFVEGTTTNTNGYFYFNKYSNLSNLLIQLSSIGYKTTILPVTELSEKITLHDETTQLNEVMIKASRPVYKMKGTNLIVNVQNSIMKDFASANEVIERLPGIKGRDGTFQISGKGEAIIYINNRKVNDAKELERLNANDIQTIEIIKNPGVQYDASTKAVIKIRLKKNENNGFGGTLTLRGRLGKRFSDSEYVQLIYNTVHINTFMSMSNYSTRLRTDQRNNNITYTSDIWNMHTNMMGWNTQYYTHNITAGISYLPHKYHTIGGSLSYSSNNDRYGGPSETEMKKGNILYENLNSNIFSWNNYKQLIGNIYYSGKWGKRWNINFNGDYIHHISDDREDNLEKGSMTPQHQVKNLLDATYNIYAGKLQFNYKLSSNMSLTFGLDGSHLSEDKSTLSTDEDVTGSKSLLRTEETKYAGFTSYEWNYKKVSLQAGIRYEKLAMEYNDGLIRETLIDKTYRHLYPSIFFSLPIGQTEMAISYTTKVKRPSFYQLRSSTEYGNRYNSTQGNPYLLPQYTSDLSYSMRYKGWQFSLSYQYIENYLAMQAVIISDDPLSRVSRPINISHHHALQGELLYHPTVGLWNPQLCINIIKTFLDIYNRNGDKVNNKSPYITASFTNSFKCPHQWNIFVDIYYTGYGHLREYRIKPYAYVNIGISKYLLNKSLLISLGIYDLFRSCKETEIRYYTNDTFEKWSYRDNRQISLLFRYNLYKNKKKYLGKNIVKEELNRL